MNKLYWSKPGYGLLLLRVAFGLMIMVHGWQKFSNFSAMSETFPDPFGVGSTLSLGLAVFAELFCGAALVLGLLTPLVLVPLMVTMLVAIFHAHGADPWQRKELAVAYLSAFATLMTCGPGRFSLDYQLFAKAK